MALSFTQLASYRRCPRQYEYCYVKKIPKGISPGEAFGAAVHNTLKRWGEREIAMSSELRAMSDQLELFSHRDVANTHSSQLTAQSLVSLWHENFPLNAFATRVEADAARMRGEELMTFFYKWWSNGSREVVAVERGFSIAMNDEGKSRMANGKLPIVLTGRFDRIERTPEGLHVIDFKTSKSRTQAEVDADLQLSIYALAVSEDFGELPVALSLLHITEDGILEMRTMRNARQVHDAIKQISAIHGRITEKDFRPTPAVSLCKYCPYRGV